MSNDLTPIKPTFDYAIVSQDQAMQLREIAIRLQVRVQRTAEEMLAMGADLRDAKRVCREDGTLFTAWCESAECPVGYSTAKRLMSVHEQLSIKKSPGDFFEVAGIKVLAEITMTRDEDIRAALLEHIEKEAEDGNKVTQKEITALKKALKEAQSQAEVLQDQAFDAKQSLEKIKADLDSSKLREKEALSKKDQYIKDLMAADKAKKDADAQHKRHLQMVQEQLRDAGEAYQEQLAEMRQRIIEEERNRPHTDAEEAAHQARLQQLRDEMSRTQQAINETAKEKDKLAAELLDLRKEVALRDQVLSDFAKSAIAFRETAVRMIGAGEALSKIPITDALYDQITMVRSLALEIAKSMESATHVD